MLRRGVDRQLAADGPDTFLDHERALTRGIQLVVGQHAGEGKALAVIGNHQLAAILAPQQANLHVPRAAVALNVDERLLCHERHLTTAARAEIEIERLAVKRGWNPGLPLERGHETRDVAHEIARRERRIAKML